MSAFSDFIKDLVGPLTGIGTAVGGGLATKGAYDRLQDIGEQAVLGTTVGGQQIPGTNQLAAEALGLSQHQALLLVLVLKCNCLLKSKHCNNS